MSDWYKLETADVLRHFDTSVETGLTTEAASRLLAEHGPNELVEKGRKSPLTIFVEQFKDLMVIILIVAAAASAFLGEIEEETLRLPPRRFLARSKRSSSFWPS